jgi:tripartite-type tricarboxylate transporter receptor subunit TctC
VIDVLIPEFEKGSIVPLALVYESRLKSLSNIPTLRELGLSIENEDRYYNNLFLWANVDKNNEEVNKVRNVLSEFLNGSQSEKFLSSMFVQFGQNNVRTPEKYINKILK